MFVNLFKSINHKSVNMELRIICANCNKTTVKQYNFTGAMKIFREACSYSVSQNNGTVHIKSCSIINQTCEV